jgi:hypothetical protein
VLWDIATVGTRDNCGANGHSAQRWREELEIHDNGVGNDASRYKSDYDDSDPRSRNLSIKQKGVVNGDRSHSPHLAHYLFLHATVTMDFDPFAKARETQRR